MSIAIIPARGGSKRIPRKNIRLFRGRPIISYAITTALESGCFDEVMVSTEDEEIAEISRSCGANVPFLRSRGGASDHATTAEVTREVLSDYESRGQVYDIACCLYPTSALVTTSRIKEAFEMLSGNNGCEGVITVVRNPQPAMRAFVIRDRFVEFMIKEQEQTRSQDGSETFFDAGQMYWLKTKPFLARESKVMAFLKRMPLILSEFETQDINTEEDWQLAEFKSKFLEAYPEVLSLAGGKPSETESFST